MKKDNPTLKKEPPFMHPSEAPRIYASGVFGGYTPHDFRLFLYSEEDDLIILVSYNNLEQIKERLENLKFLNMTYHSYHMAWAQEALMSIKSISDDDFKK